MDRFRSCSAVETDQPGLVMCSATTCLSGLASTNRSLPASFQKVSEPSWIVGRVLGGHQRFERWKVREHGGRARKLKFALPLHAFECADRFFRAVADGLLNFRVHGVPDEKKQRAGQSQNDQQCGNQKL